MTTQIDRTAAQSMPGDGAWLLRAASRLETLGFRRGFRHLSL